MLGKEHRCTGLFVFVEHVPNSKLNLELSYVGAAVAVLIFKDEHSLLETFVAKRPAVVRTSFT